MEDRKLVVFRAPADLYHDFKVTCVKERKTIREVLTQLMLNYIEAHDKN